MTDKIKKAQETVEIFKDAFKKSDYETILKALSAYEKLQGVDEMKKSYPMKGTNQAWLEGYNQAIDDVKAKLVADIGKDG